MGDLDDMMSGLDDKSNTFEILKDLTDKDKVRLFSELSDDEIKSLTRLEFLAKLLRSRYGKNVLNLELFIDTFMALRVNKKRSSRAEFVDAFKSERGNDFTKIEQRNKGQGVMR
jgi:hypothetical protein